jgi:hypothetical protein
MLPSALAQFPQRSLQLSLRRRRRQQWSDDGEAQSSSASAIPFSPISQKLSPVSGRRSTDDHRGERLSETITSYDHQTLWEHAQRSGVPRRMRRETENIHQA